jgi:hypothetical protein
MSGTHSSSQSAGQVFVEIIGLDGLAHHVGPFKSPAHAEEWIELNAGVGACAQHSPDRKITFAAGGAGLAKPAD